jgi:MFS family permease
MVAWSVTALLSGRLYVRIGYRATALLGVTCIALGIAPLTFVTAETPLPLIMVGMALAGVGFGNASTAFLLAPQSAVPWSMRGAVTSSTQFARTIGGSVGVALLGAALNARLAPAVAESDVLASDLLTPASRAALPPDAVARLSEAMADGLHRTYLVLVVVALLGVANVVLFARRSARVAADRAGGADAAKTPAADRPAGAANGASNAGETHAAAASPGVASPSRR